MLRIMSEEGRNAAAKQQPPAKYILAESVPVDGGDFVPFLPHLTIHELGKQLLKASTDGNLEEIRSLMSKGAPFSADWLGTSPLHLAAQNDHLGVVQILLQAGMSRDARTKVDRTPLHMAAYEGHLRIVDCLLMNGADYDCKDLLHMTPLHWAAQNGHAEVASLLIRYGASTTITNKFNLTAMDIALQVNRTDIVHIINLGIRDPTIATQTIALELVNENSLESSMEPIMASIGQNEEDETGTESPPTIPLETIILEDESLEEAESATHYEEQAEMTPESIETIESEENSAFSESIKLLQQHGITMLPVEDNNILSSVMESGHSVVLTEAGKQALNSIKSSEVNHDISEYLKPKTAPLPSPHVKKKKIITVTPEEFLAMANNGSFSTVPQANILKQINGKIINHSPKISHMKRIVMKKNKLVPISPNINASKMENGQDVDSLLDQLHKAYSLIESYKCKLMKCEMEVERYKYQLKMIRKQKKVSSPT